jgi:hypothetical protein
MGSHAHKQAIAENGGITKTAGTGPKVHKRTDALGAARNNQLQLVQLH